MKRPALLLVMLFGCHTWTVPPEEENPAPACEAYGCPCLGCEVPVHEGQQFCPPGTWVPLRCEETPPGCELAGFAFECNGELVTATCCPWPEQEP